MSSPLIHQTGNGSSPRLVSVDTYRGFVMALMMAEMLRTWEVARSFPESTLWGWIAGAQTHVAWVGCSLHDLIQPSFSFLVGVALPFSIASRMARGQSRTDMMGHALWRALCLILLGVFLRSIGQPQTHWTFEDTLTQIGLGYPLLFLLGFRSVRAQGWAFTVILVGYWAAWAMYPIADTAAGLSVAGLQAEGANPAAGLAAHWNKETNLGAAFDRWFLNLFPRASEFTGNRGGYLTLNFIPTLGTMLLGLIAGGWLHQPLRAETRIKRMLLAGVGGVILGLMLHALGICPIVKRIWTPSWTIFSGGCCFLMLAAFYAATDWRGWKGWTLPLRVIGLNSIAAYCIAHLFENFIAVSLVTHLGARAFQVFGESTAPVVQGAVVLLVYWLILFWMYRRKLFLKL